MTNRNTYLATLRAHDLGDVLCGMIEGRKWRCPRCRRESGRMVETPEYCPDCGREGPWERIPTKSTRGAALPNKRAATDQ